MTVFEMAKNYYERGLWSRERLDKLAEAGKLTEEERDRIVSEAGGEESKAQRKG